MRYVMDRLRMNYNHHCRTIIITKRLDFDEILVVERHFGPPLNGSHQDTPTPLFKRAG
ncbi:MAG: hypothetical protein GWP14_07960 [Actinobacteria bacterium]|nr:hypothetical protein [Actinomycetota bacterium]